MKKLILISILCLFYSKTCFAKQYNVGPYSKERTMNGQSCQQFFVYENGQEKLINVQCN